MTHPLTFRTFGPVFSLFLVMTLPSSPLSLDLRCGDIPTATLSSDVAKWLVDFLLLATSHKIEAVLEFPGKRACYLWCGW